MKKSKQKAVASFKGFDEEFKCRGFQYEVGATYRHGGKVVACFSGFHACENPFDVLRYYPLLGDDAKPNRFATVKQTGVLEREGSDSKIASANISVTAELSIPEFVKVSVDWLLKHCKTAKKKASGEYSTQAASGEYSTQAASGEYSTQAASGYGSTQAASGGYSTQAASGSGSTQAASGYGSKQAASGYGSTQAASGEYSTQAASGNGSTQAASGYGSKQAASGYGSTQAASGYGSKQAASGEYSKQAASGKNAVITAAGRNATAKGADGTWISLAEYRNAECVGFAIGCIGQDGLLADTWYRASKGKLVLA